LTLKNLETGADPGESSFLFVFIGAAPRADWLGDQVVRDSHGFIVTGPDLDPARDLSVALEHTVPARASVPGVLRRATSVTNQSSAWHQRWAKDRSR
jgi:thioredoxin reductase (NADPH)